MREVTFLIDGHVYGYFTVLSTKLRNYHLVYDAMPNGRYLTTFRTNLPSSSVLARRLTDYRA